MRADNAELARHWRLLLGSTLGICVSSSALFYYTSSVFFAELNHALGWSRSELALANVVHTAAIALLSPFAGRFMDRHGIRAPIVFSLCAQAACYAAIALLPATLPLFLSLQALLSLLGVAATPVGYSRAISARFDAKRGLALGLAMSGLGVVAILAPLVLPRIVEAVGWRGGYLSLSAFVVLLGAPAMWLLGPEVDRAPVRPAAAPAQATHDLPLHRRPLFWLLIAAFVLPMLFGSGYIVHFIAMMRDRGLSATEAGTMAALIGVAVLLGRLVTGLLIDHLFAPRVIAVVMLLFAGGLLLLTTGHPMLALPAAFTIGFAMGAELDVLAYLVSRYFPIARFGRTYGVFYGALMAGGACSALLIAQLHARTGSYDVPLVLSAAMLVLAAALFLLAPRFPSSPASS